MRISVLFRTLVVASAILAVPANAAPTTCSSTTSCAVYQNTSSGPAIHAQSVGGFGIRSNSSAGGGIYGSSGSGTFMSAGIDGESTDSTSGDAGGVFGLAGYLAGTAPAYGVVGYGRIQGVVGSTTTATTNGVAVDGNDVSSGKSSTGVIGYSGHGTGILGESGATPSSGAVGVNPIGVYGVGNTQMTNGGIGLYGESDNTAIFGFNTKTKTQICFACGDELISAASTGTFSADDDGNVSISGTITTSKGTYVRSRGPSGTTRLSYGQRTTAPELEDVGEGQLVNGRALVRIDAALADGIDRTRPYHVFVTPEGDSKGLYVSERTPAGFIVREQQGGRSTLAFEYRIVAKPVGQTGERLAIVPALDQPKPLVSRSGPQVPRPLSPLEELRARIGPVAFAKAVREYQRRQTAP